MAIDSIRAVQYESQRPEHHFALTALRTKGKVCLDARENTTFALPILCFSAWSDIVTKKERTKNERRVSFRKALNTDYNRLCEPLAITLISFLPLRVETFHAQETFTSGTAILSLLWATKPLTRTGVAVPVVCSASWRLFLSFFIDLSLRGVQHKNQFCITVHERDGLNRELRGEWRPRSSNYCKQLTPVAPPFHPVSRNVHAKGTEGELPLNSRTGSGRLVKAPGTLKRARVAVLVVCGQLCNISFLSSQCFVTLGG